MRLTSLYYLWRRTLLFLLLPTTLFAQTTMDWNFLGPDNYGGTTRALQVDIGEPERVYAGCTTGGLWVSDNTGKQWKASGLVYPFVSCIAQAISGDLYVGTGDFFEANTGYGYGGRPGNGIYKSTDKGKTFQQLRGTLPAKSNSVEGDWQYVIELAVHPTNPKRVYAATNTGLFWSNDAGSTWSLVPNLPRGMVFDIVISTKGEIHTFIDDTYYYSKQDHSFATNTGEELGQIPPISGRKSLAVSPSNPAFVYAVATDPQNCMYVVYKSEMGGDVWFEIGRRNSLHLAPFTEIQPYSWRDLPTCKGDYAQEIVVHPTDPERIIVAGAIIYQWSAIDHWQEYQEVQQYGNGRYFRNNDIHKIVYSPHNPKHIYVGTDAGIFRSLNGGSSFHYRVDGYQTAQITGMDFMANGSLIAGTQRHGLQHLRFRELVPISGEVLWHGRLVDVFASKLRSNMVLPLLTEGHALRTLNMENFPWFLGDAIDCIPASGQGGCLGDGKLDNGASYFLENAYWEDITSQQSQYLTGDSLGVVWYSENIPKLNEAGGFDAGSETSWLPLDTLTDAEGQPSVITTTQFSADGNVAWVGSSSGALMRLVGFQEDSIRTQSFTPSFFAQGEQQRYVSAIAIDPNDANKVLIALGGFDHTTYLYGTSSGMSDFASFKSIQNDLPNCPIYDVLVDYADANHLMAATEKGLFHSYNNGLDWLLDDAGVPFAPIHRIKQLAHPRIGNRIVTLVAVYGGGVYASGFSPSDLATSVDHFSSEYDASMLRVYPNPTSDFVYITGWANQQEQVQASLYDLQGRLILQEQVTLSEGVDLSGIVEGSYLLKLANGAATVSKKVFVLR